MSSTRQVRLRFLAIAVPRHTGFPAHDHDTHQLLLVDRGALAVTTDDAQWAVPARSGVWLPAGRSHGLSAIDDAFVLFAYLGRHVESGASHAGVVAIRPLLRELMTRLSEPSGVAGARRERLEAVLLDEIAHIQAESALVPLPRDESARAIADRVLAEPADPRSFDELAHEAGASTRTLQRRYRAETGLTFQAWRRRARVQCALGWLAEGAPISIVAHDCGFSSVSAFVHAFRGELGTTPAVWRRDLDDPAR
jgi:AraC-like DNA-binding protein